jgi:hypothetical protein
VTSPSRRIVDLDGEWRFVPDPDRRHDVRALPDGQPIQVPGCWEPQVSAGHGIVTAWYHRPVPIPATAPGDRLVLRFGAVMERCRVYLDGTLVAEHEGGYTPFTVDLSSVGRRGEESRLALRVVNPSNALTDYPTFDGHRLAAADALVPDTPLTEVPHGKQTWYTSTSGIWQSVRLECLPATSLAALQVRPDLGHERITVRWRLDRGPTTDRPRARARSGRENGRRARSDETIELLVLDPHGAEVAAIEFPVPVEAEAGQVELAIPGPRLWDVGQPELYRIEATLLAAGERVDWMSERFGMRSIEASDGRIVLNGRPIYLRGALDQDVYPETLAGAPSRAYVDEQLRRAHEMGINLLRCHMKIPDPAYFEAADEAGILVWCELPSWSRFTTAAAERGRATLRAAVELAYNHPSVVAWTIINEDWGTQLRHEARDRLWLRETFEWLKERDPSRLVVDNSACETRATPNFHVRSDLADFHLYFAMPDNADRCRAAYADFAGRPAWLWSPHGDAQPTGAEPLVLSEFGNWGLPRIEWSDDAAAPWWAATGQGTYLPAGVRGRFDEFGLGRIWPSLEALAEATQWHQFEALQYEIGQLRRHGSISGYVITELTDAYWEANGLLDLDRRPKVFHDRLGELNADDAVVLDLAERDLWGGGALDAEVYVSSYGVASTIDRGTVRWRLVLEDGAGAGRKGQLALRRWPRSTSVAAGRLQVELPDVPETTDARLVLTAFDGDGRERARSDLRFAILPAAARRSADPLPVAVHDSMDVFRVRERIAGLGHGIVPLGEARLLVTTELLPGDVEHADRGGHVLVLVRSRDAVRGDLGLAATIEVQGRKIPPLGVPGQRTPWDGDWVSNFNWIVAQAFPRLPRRAPLDFAYTQVSPDHVLIGEGPVSAGEEVSAGMFVGWIHAPAALVWSVPQGRGSITLTTFRLAPESGPVATVMLDELIQRAARVGSRGRRRAEDRLDSAPSRTGTGTKPKAR